MNSWLDAFYLWFMFVPRKHYPFGNEHYLVVDEDDGNPIMLHIELQEGKDRPWKRHANGYSFRGPRGLRPVGNTRRL